MRVLGRWRLRMKRGARSAWKTVRRTSPETPTHNIIALSDLHLGCDLRSSELTEPPPIDEPLGALLAHYAQHREDGRPWRLLLVGDIVDFIAITRVPEPGETSFEASDFERRCGLAPEPDKACWKLAQVAERHVLAFTRLAQFVQAGNEIIIIRGNHDPDWCWPKVQELMRTLLVSKAWPDGAASGLAGRRRRAELAAMRQRIRFEDWFHFEHGRVYAEHGHHYDEYSITDDLMRRPDGGQRLSEPVSTLALRYFSNKHPGLDLSQVDRWRMRDYVRWARSEGGFLRYFGDYVEMCLRVSAFTLKASVGTMWRSVGALLKLPKTMVEEEGKMRHVRELLCVVKADHEGLAQEISALMKPPAADSFWATARMLYFDRMLLGAGVVFSASACVAVSGSPWMRLGAFAAVAGLAGVLNAWLDRARLIESHPKLLAAAHRVSVLFAAPIVIMGHSHREVDCPVGDGSRYFNLGTWLGRDEKGFPHVVLTDSGARMRRWGAGQARVEVA